MTAIHHNELVNSLSNLFGSSKYSDLTIRCGPDLYEVHRAVICQRSEFFAAACDSGFKEAMTTTITLNDDDPSTVRRILTYLYTLDYDDADASQAVAVAASQNADSNVLDSSSKPEAIDDATTSHRKRMNNVLIYALADKYNIPALKELAKTKFQNCKAGYSYSLYRDVISAVYESTPDTDSGLRDIVILECAKEVEDILDEERVAPMIRDNGSLSLGLLREVVKQKEVTQTKTTDLLMSLHTELGSLNIQASNIQTPRKGDSVEDFAHSYQALEEVQLKLFDVWNNMKLGV